MSDYYLQVTAIKIKVSLKNYLFQFRYKRLNVSRDKYEAIKVLGILLIN